MKLNYKMEEVEKFWEKDKTTNDFIVEDWLTMHAELARLNDTIRLLREDGERLMKWILTSQLEPFETEEQRKLFSVDFDQHNALLKQLDEQEKK